MDETTFQEQEVKRLIGDFPAKKDMSALVQKQLIGSRDGWFSSAKAGSRAHSACLKAKEGKEPFRDSYSVLGNPVPSKTC